ncbi:PREDICTED: uncharacterized protein LOC108565576 isoform X1 [Nicrophorus vespilloides]|uniref:Uncharacterized protein LOC108565576 isoform X1 n=1 Tax=Nicrophorus vespilloides TaxID=110193 RepID=A0ABM1N1A2_NICVS|nr:PREDICTED: uncharacterized protein LOC108565576 isoform X1 [Nicrophorus vespilloides]
MKAYLVLFSIGLLFGTAVGLDCWQCNSLEESCEANTEKQQWEQDCEKQSYDAVLGLPSFFAPKIPFPLLEEARGMPKMNCVTFRFETYTTKTCMKRATEQVKVLCETIHDYLNIPVECDVCDENYCNSSSKLNVHHTIMLLVSMFMFFQYYKY